MLLHIFGLRWKPNTPDDRKAKALDDIHAFAHSIPGILALHAGPNLSRQSRGYETVGVLHFADRHALEAYLGHPVHQEFVASVRDHIEAVDLDLEIPPPGD